MDDSTANKEITSGPRKLLASVPHGRLLMLVGLAILVVLIAVGIWLFLNGVGVENLASLGYPGVFIVMLLGGSAIVLPMPGPPVVVAAGAVWNPFLVGFAAGLGNATAEMLSYATGRAAITLLDKYQNARLVATLRRWLDRYGFFAILVIAAIPNPVFHVLSLLAGSTGYSARRFWVACLIGNSVKYIGYAYLGRAGLAFWQ